MKRFLKNALIVASLPVILGVECMAVRTPEVDELLTRYVNWLTS